LHSKPPLPHPSPGVPGEGGRSRRSLWIWRFAILITVLFFRTTLSSAANPPATQASASEHRAIRRTADPVASTQAARSAPAVPGVTGPDLPRVAIALAAVIG